MMQNNISEQSLLLISESIKRIQQENLSHKILELRLQALSDLPGYLSTYLESNLLIQLIDVVCEKKVCFIMQATTIGEIKQIMKPPKPIWAASGVYCQSKYYIPEEELLIWAIVSPHHKLLPAASDRYINLFKQVFGFSVDPLMYEKDDCFL